MEAHHGVLEASPWPPSAPRSPAPSPAPAPMEPVAPRRRRFGAGPRTGAPWCPRPRGWPAPFGGASPAKGGCQFWKDSPTSHKKSTNLPLPTYLLTYLPTYLITYLITYLPACLPTCLPTYLITNLITYLPTYLPVCLPTYLATYSYLPNYLPTYLRTYLPTSYIPTYITCLPTNVKGTVQFSGLYLLSLTNLKADEEMSTMIDSVFLCANPFGGDLGHFVGRIR